MNKEQFMDFLHDVAEAFDTAADTGKLTMAQHKELFNMAQTTFKKAKSQNYNNCAESASELAKEIKKSKSFWKLLGDICKKYEVTS